jgi:hypothetical protein
VPREGIEPSWDYSRTILSRVRLPVPPPRLPCSWDVLVPVEVGNLVPPANHKHSFQLDYHIL